MERGGTITWYLNADDSDFERAMRKARAEAAATGAAVDKELTGGTTRARKSTSELNDETNDLASTFRSLETHLDNLGERFDGLETTVDALGHSTDNLDSSINRLRFDKTDKQLSNVSRTARRTRNSFDDLRLEMSRSANMFQNFQIISRGFVMTAAILGVTTLTGAVVELAGALASLIGLFNAVPAGVFSVISAFATIKTATYGMGDAFKAVASGDADKLAEALEKLSPQAQAVVKSFQKINDAFKPIRTAVQDAFFKDLGTQMDQVAAVTLPTLKKGLVDVATAMNGLAKEAARVAKEPFFQNAIAGSLQTTAQATTILKGAVQPLAVAIAGLLAVGNPYVLLLAEWVVKETELFAAFVNSARGQELLTAQIEAGISALQLLGNLLGSVGGLLIELFKQSSESGGSLIVTITEAFNAMTQFLQTTQGMQEFQSLLRVTNEVFKDLLGIVSIIAKAILDFTAAIDGLPGPFKDLVIQTLAWSSVLAFMLPYLSSVVSALDFMRDTALATSKAFGTFAAELIPGVKVVRDLDGGLVALGGTAKNAGLGKILLTWTGPIALLVTALGGLAYALGGTGEAATIFQNFFQGIPATINNIAAQLPAFIGQIGNMIEQIAQQIVKGLPMLIEVGTQIILSLVNGILGAIPSLIGTFGQLVQSVLLVLVRAIPLLINAAGQLILGIVQGIVANLPAIIASIVTLIETIVNTIVTLLPELADSGLKVIEGLIDGVTKALPQLIKGAVTIIQSLINGIIKLLPELITAGLAIVMALLNSIVKNLPLIINGAVQLVNALVTGIVQALPTIIFAVIQLFLAILKAIVDNLPLIIQAAVTIIDTLSKAFSDNLPTIIDAVIQITLAIFNALIDNMPMLVNAMFTILLALTQAIIDNIPTILGGIFRVITAIVSALIGAVGSVISAGFQLIGGLISGIVKAGPNILRSVGDTILSIILGFGEGVGQLVTAGVNLINGLIKGIASAKNAVVNKVKEIASGALDAIKNFFGIHSPSRVMASMGNYLMEGLEKGIAQTGKDVIETAQGIASDIYDSFTSLDGSSVNVNGTSSISAEPLMAPASVNASDIPVAANGTRNGIEVNQYNTVNTPVDMDKVVRDLTWELGRA